MFENITRIFSTNDPDSGDESEDWIDQEQPGDLSNRPNNSDEQATRNGPEEQFEDLGNRPDNSDEQTVDDGPDVAELDVRLDELDDELDSTESSLRALRSSQEEMNESIEEINDTVRQLVGIYDRLVAEDNPFIDDPDNTVDNNTVSPTSGINTDENNNQRMGRQSATDETSDDGTVVSFDDLQEQADDELIGESRHLSDASAGDESSNANRTNQFFAENRDWVSASTRMADDDSAPVLVSIPDGYAGEVLVMEWIATLMDRSGPAGALRAINYYENIGWISTEVKDHLIDVIGGPALDVFVNPTQPHEPTADEHAVSNEYLRVLNRLTQI